MTNSKHNLLNELSQNKKLEINDFIEAKEGYEWNASEILESWKGFQSMLFLTPPKIHDFKSPSPSPSPLLDIMQSLNDILSSEEEKRKVLDPELIKLLDGTPVQTTSKKFEAKKSSRNISNLFWTEEETKNGISRSDVIELKKVPGRQPFYPQNYGWSSWNTGYAPQSQKFEKVLSMKQMKENNTMDQLSKQSKQNNYSNKWRNEPYHNENFHGQKLDSKQNTKEENSFNLTVKTFSEKIPQRKLSSNSDLSNKENLNIGAKQEKKDNSSFSFPEGGWVWSFWQNYNFYGRIKCNRCSKYKTKDDWEGKPQHIIRKEIKSRK